jgi:phasin family protein
MATNKTTNAAKTAQDTLEAVAAAQKKTFEEAFQAGTDAFTKGYEQFYATAREQMDKAQKSAFENLDQFADFGRENVEAMIVSGNIVAKGVEVVGKEIAAFAQKQAEANMAAAKKLGAVKNPQEFLDLQTALAKAAFDEIVAETTKLQDMSTQVSNEAAQPINDRINKAVETFAKPIAA